MGVSFGFDVAADTFLPLGVIKPNRRFEVYCKIVVDIAIARGPDFAAIVQRLRQDYQYSKEFVDQVRNPPSVVTPVAGVA